jgi:hypothetical protein
MLMSLRLQARAALHDAAWPAYSRAAAAILIPAYHSMQAQLLSLMYDFWQHLFLLVPFTAVQLPIPHAAACRTRSPV